MKFNKLQKKEKDKQNFELSFETINSEIDDDLIKEVSGLLADNNDLDEMKDFFIDAEDMFEEELDEFIIDDERLERLHLEELLADNDLKLAELILMHKKQRIRFVELAKKLKFPLDKPYDVSFKISKMKSVSPELQEFLAMFLSHRGQLFINDISKCKPDVIIDYIFYIEDVNRNNKIINDIQSLDKNWRFIEPKLKKKEPINFFNSNVSSQDIIDVYYKIFNRGKVSTENFKHNLDEILTDINNTHELQLVAPLYLYQILVKHSSRIKVNQYITVDPTNLWKYKEYVIHDNGKNFNKNFQHIKLFNELCDLFEASGDITVSIALSKWGFMLMSNLVEFERSVLEDNDDVCDITFPYFDELVESSLFSCKNNKDIIGTLKEFGTSISKLKHFEHNYKYQPDLHRISTYMNENAMKIFDKFLVTNNGDIKNLCRYILCDSTNIEKKGAKKETMNLFLAEIYLALHELVDFYAKENIVNGLINIFRNAE